MNSLPIEYGPRAVDDLRAVPRHFLPAVLEHLTRLSANHTTCSRPTAFPHPPGLESGVWLRHTQGAVMVLVFFRLEVTPERIVVRRVVLTDVPRVPDWTLRPEEWGNAPWPVVDL